MQVRHCCATIGFIGGRKSFVVPVCRPRPKCRRANFDFGNWPTLPCRRLELRIDKMTIDSGLHSGDLVRVRSKEEILRTLDKKAQLQNLPFMPEMFEFCGKQ